MKRRDFLKKAGTGATAATAGALLTAPYVHAQKNKTYKWKMVTTWAPKSPLLMDAVDRFVKRVDVMSGGRLKIRAYGAGELVPAFGCFDAVSKGTVQAANGASYYWAGNVPAAQWFSCVPFGLNAQGMAAWFFAGDGLKLWEETYAPFNLIPRPSGNTGVQMGGWFNKKINTLSDFKGLKFRIPGLGGRVVAQAGGAVVLTPGPEIFTNLERGVIDATEWIGPFHDLVKGFYKVAKYYYYPGWHEPGTSLETIFNKQAYEALPKELQIILDTAAKESYPWLLSGFDAANGNALQELVNKHKVRLLRFPEEVMFKLKVMADEVVEDTANKDPVAKKVNANFRKFQKKIGIWGQVSERAYYDVVAQQLKL
ncbi:MAG: TRAP transporter substrate-binding protein [Desulfarculaceae bacterium]